MALRDFSYNNQSKFTVGYTTEPMEFVALKNPSKFLAETLNNGMHANGKSHKYQFELSNASVFTNEPMRSIVLASQPMRHKLCLETSL